VIEAVKQADWVIVPLIYESPLEMQVTINAIAEIERYTKQIVIIVNKATPLIAGHAREVLAKFYTYPVLEVKSTTAFRHGIAKGMSLEELVKSNPIFRFHYRVPLAQLRAILEFIA
jgi:hypothetical protein